MELIESQALVPDGLLTHTMRLDGVPRALGMMARGEALKVLITPGGGASGRGAIAPRN